MTSGKYFWLKLQRDFFKRHDIRIVENMQNGKDYILFYLKLLCESVDHEGNLRFSENIPYNENMLAAITNTNVDIVRSAIAVFTELKMMEILDDGTIYMTAVERMIGSAEQNEHTRESTRERVRAYRERKKQEKLLEQIDGERYGNVTSCYGSVTCNGEIEIEKELDIELKKETKKAPSGAFDLEKALEEYTWTAEMKEIVRDWFNYKKEKRQPYKPQGAKALLKAVDKYIGEIGEPAVRNQILSSMASNYQGMGLERIQAAKPRTATRANFTERKGTEDFTDLIRIRVEDEGGNDD